MLLAERQTTVYPTILFEYSYTRSLTAALIVTGCFAFRLYAVIILMLCRIQFTLFSSLMHMQNSMVSMLCWFSHLIQQPEACEESQCRKEVEELKHAAGTN